MNFENAIRGMRNPLNSWDKSDSYVGDSGRFIIGENDLALAKRLVAAGSDHRKFLRQILVSVDVLAPLYWYKEYDTYKVGTVANSCSTMHTVHKKEFALDDFSTEHLSELSLGSLAETIKVMNVYREDFLATSNKESWWQMIQLLPTSYNQLRTITLNYEVLRNIYHSRKAHKLDEWHTFCDWIKTLPYSELIYE
jgi:hypothetical protein